MASDRPNLVERRLRFIERQRELHKETVSVSFKGLTPAGSGPPNRHRGWLCLSVNMSSSTRPILNLGEQPNVPLKDWRLEIERLVEFHSHSHGTNSSRSAG